MRLDCKSMDERLVDYVYDELENEELASMKAHLEECPECREQVESLMGTRTVMSRIEQASPTRDDTYVLQVARRQAKSLGMSEESPGLLERFGSWFSKRPGLVAVPAAGLMLVAIVTVTLGDEIRSVFGASADSLAGETLGPPTLLQDKAAKAPDADREARGIRDFVGPSRSLEEERRLGDRDLAPPEHEHEPGAPQEESPAGQVVSPLPERRAAPARGRSVAKRLSKAPAEQAQTARRSAAPPPSSRAAQDPFVGSSPGPGVQEEASRPEVEDRVLAPSRSRPPPAAKARRAPSPGPRAEYSAEADVHQAPGDESLSLDLEDSSQPDRFELHPTLQRAANLLSRGEYEEVLALLAGFSSSSGELMARAHALRAQSFERLGRHSEARTEWQRALEADPEGSSGADARRALESR